LVYLRKIRDTLSASTETTPLTAELGRVVGEAEAALDGDALLAASIQRAGNVFLASRYENVGAAAPLPAYVRRSTAPDPGTTATTLQSAQHPILSLGTVAAGVGHVYAEPDNDGRVRQIPLLLRYDSVGVPSLALLAVQHSLHLGLDDLRRWMRRRACAWAGEYSHQCRSHAAPSLAGVRRQRSYISRSLGRESARWNGSRRQPQGQDRAGGRNDRCAGRAAARVEERLVHPVEVLAQAVSSMRLGLGVVEPGWAMPVTWLVLALALLYVVLVAPRLARPWVVAWVPGSCLRVLSQSGRFCVTEACGFRCCCPFWPY